ncbi:hypothetical protein D1871_04950 [Nakamurella silvestris]|nr:hypothetical protein D1871_04950 [Nakamurella silvestris]
MIERFSEDVDLLVVFPEGMGATPRDRALKKLAGLAAERLLLSPDPLASISKKGVKREVHLAYSTVVRPHAQIQELVRLEMGSRGGTDPHTRHRVRSMVANYAINELGESDDTWEEFAEFEVNVLNPERTLLEKSALLHDIAVNACNDPQSASAARMRTCGRHYYDVAALVNSPAVRAELENLGTEGIADLAARIDEVSDAAGWPWTPRPTGGYGDSPAFTPPDEFRVIAEVAYNDAVTMVYGARPTFEEALTSIRLHMHLL